MTFHILKFMDSKNDVTALKNERNMEVWIFQQQSVSFSCIKKLYLKTKSLEVIIFISGGKF